jgi:hypothetical protein
MVRPLALISVSLIVACSPSAPESRAPAAATTGSSEPSQPNRASTAPATPTETANAAHPTAGPSDPSSRAASGAAVEGPLTPYRIVSTTSAQEATSREEIKVSWTVEGGPRSSGIEPRVRVKAQLVPIVKPGQKNAPSPSTLAFPTAEDPCAAPPLGPSVSFPMPAKQNAAIEVSVVGCRAGKAEEATRAMATSRVAWVSPYVEALDVPAVLKAGETTQATLRFRGIDGPSSAGAPPKVSVSSSHPGVTITKQPAVAASATFEIAVKPNVTGDVKLTAQHVNTDGNGRILGVVSRAATVRVRAP